MLNAVTRSTVAWRSQSCGGVFRNRRDQRLHHVADQHMQLVAVDVHPRLFLLLDKLMAGHVHAICIRLGDNFGQRGAVNKLLCRAGISQTVDQRDYKSVARCMIIAPCQQPSRRQSPHSDAGDAITNTPTGAWRSTDWIPSSWPVRADHYGYMRFILDVIVAMNGNAIYELHNLHKCHLLH